MVDVAFLLAPGGLATGSAWPGFYPPGRPAQLLTFYLYASQVCSPKFAKSVRWSTFSFKDGFSPVRATCSFPFSFPLLDALNF